MFSSLSVVQGLGKYFTSFRKFLSIPNALGMVPFQNSYRILLSILFFSRDDVNTVLYLTFCVDNYMKKFYNIYKIYKII